MPQVIIKTKGIAALVCILIAATAFGQRSIGAARFIIDDRTTSVRTVTLEATSPMTSQAYTLKFPAAAPGNTGGYKNVLAFDNNGNSVWVSGFAVVTNATLLGDGTPSDPLRINLGNANSWTAHQTFSGGLTASGSATNLNSVNTNVNGTNFTTSASTNSTFNGPVTFNNTVSMPLPLNNIFVGNASNRAAPLAPLGNRILTTDPVGNVSWSNALPPGTTIPFSQISTGTNSTATMTVGAGASIIAGGGINEATRFLGAGSLTTAVDLATAEVSGILPTGNGGTGKISHDQDELLLGNGASPIASLNNPVGNAILTQDGVGTPEWSTSLPGGVTVPFSQISTGTNTTATMTVGAGASIIAGGGINEATRYFGTGSVTNQVDLGTAEVAGILPGSKGGTGVTAVDLNEVVLGNGATGIQSLDNPAAARILTHPGGAAVAPTWSTSLPAGVTVPFSQVTSGLNAGQSLQVGAGSTITPTGTGVVTANNVVGAGPNKFSGSVAITQNIVSQAIPFSGLANGATIMVSIEDPNMPGVLCWVTAKTAAVGFTVTFSASYPTNTGMLHYTVINP